MDRRGGRGAGLLVLGAVIVGVDVHAIVTYRAPAGSQQTTTLGQVGGLLLGVVLVVIGGLLFGTVLRRRLETWRRRRLRQRLESREFGSD